MRLAFGTFLGIPEPSSFMGDASFVVPRWNADPSAAFVAEIDGRIVGSNFAARWGKLRVPGAHHDAAGRLGPRHRESSHGADH